MKTYAVLLAAFMLLQNVKAQVIENIAPDTEVFCNSYQFSSIAVRNGLVYLPAEKCNRIILLDTGTLKKADSLLLSFPENDSLKAEIEGVAFYKNYMLLTDEGNGKIWYVDINSINNRRADLKEVIITSKKYKKKIAGDTGEFGIEGIAVNEKLSVCYVLKEKNTRYQSKIRQFKINVQNGILCFDNGNSSTITHGEDPSGTWRYSDIYLRPGDNNADTLFLLKSSFNDKNESISIYGIDFINEFDISGILADTPVVKVFGITEKLTQYLTKDSLKYSSNAEGLTFWKNNILIITDNVQDSLKSCDTKKKKTILLSIKR